MDLITMDDLTNDESISLLEDARRLMPVANGSAYLPLLEGKVLGNLFFENSTRTRLSFETAMKRLGGEVLNLSDVGSSVKKGETLYDTMQMIDGYADIAVIRHPRQGAAQDAADAVEIPILNAGDGAGNHPTQTLLDLFTIKQGHGTIQDLRVVLVGDLRYGRTVHSLSHALSRFGASLTFVSPEFDLPLFSNTIIPYDGDRGGRCDKGKSIEFFLTQLPIFDFQHILPTNFATWYVHDKRDWIGLGPVYV